VSQEYKAVTQCRACTWTAAQPLGHYTSSKGRTVLCNSQNEDHQQGSPDLKKDNTTGGCKENKILTLTFGQALTAF